MRKVAVFGGSFNPVHNGHIALVERMKEEFSLNEIIIIPTYVTPLKDNTPMVSPYHRLNMLKLAFEDKSYVSVSDIEIVREGKSYSVDTLREIRKSYPEDSLYFIVGADSFMQLPLWKSPEDIFSIAHILTISRDDLDYEELLQRANEYENKYNARCSVLPNSVSEVSSTKVRNKISEKVSVKDLIPQRVSEYIKEQGLYG